MGQDKFREPANITTTKNITSVELVTFPNEGEHLWKEALGIEDAVLIKYKTNE